MTRIENLARYSATGAAIGLLTLGVALEGHTAERQARATEAKGFQVAQSAGKDISTGKRDGTKSQRAARPATRQYVPKVITAPAPGSNKGLGTRGSGDPAPVLAVLAPSHTGLTTQEQPSLFWYISSTTGIPIVFTLIEKDGTEPLIEKQLPPPAQGGIQRIRLEDFDVQLEMNKVYFWHVELVLNPNAMSLSVVASGAITRVRPTHALSAKLANTGKSEAPSVYAGEGLWYDAMASISDLIEAAPTDAGLRRQRAALLEDPEVELVEVAVYDTAMAAGNGG